MNISLPLKRKHVLVTRPEGLAESLCDDIKKHGATVTHFPVIEITEPANKKSQQYAITTINSYDIALFISPTAVKQTLRHIKPASLPSTIGAIGTATLAALEQETLFIAIKSEGHNSEALLKHPELQADLVNTKRIIIFKGEGGLKIIADTLKSRGADVFTADMYRRIQPKRYQALTPSTLDSIDTILVSSGDGLKNLLKMTENIDSLIQKNIIVPGERCATIARELGFVSVITSDNATNDSFLMALLNQKS